MIDKDDDVNGVTDADVTGVIDDDVACVIDDDVAGVIDDGDVAGGDGDGNPCCKPSTAADSEDGALDKSLRPIIILEIGSVILLL